MPATEQLMAGVRAFLYAEQVRAGNAVHILRCTPVVVQAAVTKN